MVVVGVFINCYIKIDVDFPQPTFSHIDWVLSCSGIALGSKRTSLVFCRDEYSAWSNIPPHLIQTSSLQKG